MQVYCEELQRFRLAARGHGPVQPPAMHRDRIETYFDPLPFWYTPFEEEMVAADDYPLHALTQRPMHMYHSWGSQNAWLRQLTSHNHLYINRATAAKLGIADDDWVWVESHVGRVKGQARLVEGTNADTVWTWNAIGKRRGAWNLSANAPESNKGFLLNHVISDLLPERVGGYRYANSDPVTGQAAWFDLRVRVTKCLPEEVGATEPTFAPQPPLPASPPRLAVGRYGADLKGQGKGIDGTAHAEWLGNRREVAATVAGVPDGFGNRIAAPPAPLKAASDD